MTSGKIDSSSSKAEGDGAMNHHKTSRIAVLAAAVLVVTGCSGEQGLKALDRPATASR